MRSSRPHFKYIFHYGGADKQHCRFQKQSPFFFFRRLRLPTEIRRHRLPPHNVSLWWCLDCPKLKAFVSKLRGELQALSQNCDSDAFYFVFFRPRNHNSSRFRLLHPPLPHRPPKCAPVSLLVSQGAICYGRISLSIKVSSL